MDIKDGGKLLGYNGAGLLLPLKKSSLPLVLWSLVLDLELVKDLDHSRNEGLVLALYDLVLLLNRA